MTEPAPAPTARSLEVDIEVPGTVEEVWEAIATGPGITSWFIPMEVEEHAGGEATMDWGPTLGTQIADVVAWEPPHRVVFRGRGDDAMAFEWLVEAREGGTCLVRLVNTGFGEGDEWDQQLESMGQGWRIFLQNLRLHLSHFPGRSARASIPTVQAAGPKAAAWTQLCEALGLPPDATPGTRVATAEGVPPLGGVVDSVVDTAMATAYLLVVDEPNPGTAFVAVEGSGEVVAPSVYLYLYEDADRPVDPAIGPAWTDWLTARYPGTPAVDLASPGGEAGETS